MHIGIAFYGGSKRFLLLCLGTRNCTFWYHDFLAVGKFALWKVKNESIILNHNTLIWTLQLKVFGWFWRNVHVIYMFDGILNIPLCWCIWCNLKGVFLVTFLTFSILLFYLNIGNFYLLFNSIFVFRLIILFFLFIFNWSNCIYLLQFLFHC